MYVKMPASSFEIYQWNSNYETGIKTIDTQNRQLIDLFNMFSICLSDYSSDSNLNELFEELISYAEYCFYTEESIWSRYFLEDEWYQAHELSHRDFIVYLLALKNSIKNKPFKELAYETISLLSTWLGNHILGSDNRMSKALILIQKGISIDTAKLYSKEIKKSYLI